MGVQGLTGERVKRHRRGEWRGYRRDAVTGGNQRKGGNFETPSASYRAMQNSSAKEAGERRPANACRDRELIRLVGRHGLVTIEHLMSAMGVGQAITYRRVARCIDAGLLERHAILASEPSVLRATQAGLRFAGLVLPTASISPATVTHTLRCAGIVIATERSNPDWRILTEREIVLAEQLEGRRIASVRIGTAHGKPRYHRADMAAFTEEGVLVAEMELTPKSPARLRTIIAAWYRAPYIHCVDYLCAPGQTHRAVKRTVKKLRAQEKIVVVEWGR